jgi:Caspase domain/Domain of unknown function (DUF4384)
MLPKSTQSRTTGEWTEIPRANRDTLTLHDLAPTALRRRKTGMKEPGAVRHEVVMIEERFSRGLFRGIAICLALVTVCALMFTSPAQAARRALLVGVEAYLKPMKPLRGVRDDVKMVTEVLTKQNMFSKSEIKTLMDHQATKANIVRNFKQWLIDGTAPGDTVLFYFSGHGAQVWDENGDEVQDGLDEVLICYDSKFFKRKVRRTFRGQRGSAFAVRHSKNLLLDDEIRGLLKQLQGRNVVFISDSCHSGSVYKRLDPFFVQNKTIDEPIAYKSVFDSRVSDAGATKARRNTNNIGADLRVPGSNLVVFTASEDSQPAQIVRFRRHPNGLHSVFTWHLYHGLMGRADLDKNGTVTFEELARFVHDEVRRAGFAQIPQSEFIPKSIASESLASTVGSPATTIKRPTRIGCSVEALGVPSSEVARFKSELKAKLAAIDWSEKSDQVSCRIKLQKKSGVYGARLSDSSGAYWETQKGSDLASVATALAGNLRAYYIQTSLTALSNAASRLRLSFTYEVKGKKRRASGEAAQGDSILFKASTSTPGYLYIFNVGVRGVIHPLYPAANAGPVKLTSGNPLALGSGSAFVVKPPFGKEMIFAFLFRDSPASLSSFWAKDDIGDAQNQTFREQQRFLDALWNGLTASGKPKGDWTSQMWLIKSFEK